MAALHPARWALAAAVLLGHLALLNGLAENRVGWGASDRAAPRMEVAFVRELAQAAPAAPAPVAAPAAPPARLPAVAARAPRHSASAPRPVRVAEAESVPPPVLPAPNGPPITLPDPSDMRLPHPAPQLLPVVPPVAVVDLPAPASAPVVPAQPAVAAAASSASAAGAASNFNWPPSTRMNYRLAGDYRGPVTGRAQVEWLREGNRYQVRMESSAGPLFRRQVVSEGELGDQGLVPQRFSGEQKILFASPRRWSLSFNAQRAVLADGTEVPAQAGTQDEASQFVQLTWLFTVNPERLQVGRSVDVPLAINRKLERWTFDVVGQETLNLPFGPVDTFHVKPRREATGGDFTAEMWFAPTLQYLPVRILIRQRQEHWVDLTLDKPPLQAAPSSSGG